MGLWDDIYRGPGITETDGSGFEEVAAVQDSTPSFSAAPQPLKQQQQQDGGEGQESKGGEKLTNREKFEQRMEKRAEEKDQEEKEKTQETAQQASDKSEAVEDGASGNQRVEQSAQAHSEGKRLQEMLDGQGERKEAAEQAQKKMDMDQDTINSIIGSVGNLGSQIQEAVKPSGQEDADMIRKFDDGLSLSGLAFGAMNELEL